MTHKLTITSNGSGARAHRVYVDGKKVPAVQAIDLHMDASTDLLVADLGVASVTLGLPVIDSADVDAWAKVVLDEATTATLVALGWTPPFDPAPFALPDLTDDQVREIQEAFDAAVVVPGLKHKFVVLPWSDSVNNKAAAFAKTHGSFSLWYEATENPAHPDALPWTLTLDTEDDEIGWGGLTAEETVDFAASELAKRVTEPTVGGDPEPAEPVMLPAGSPFVGHDHGLFEACDDSCHKPDGPRGGKGAAE